MKYKRTLDEEFVWSPITEENYWTIGIRDIKKVYVDRNGTETPDPNHKEVACPDADGCKAIVDTGTYLIYGPKEKIDDLLSDVVLDNCANK
jgi:hypothetical protein